ncbi:hypothetical protein L7F22_037758 [Adiantum nelumboides]|nr:hypothetical protein [Adiantum nelumboides]
MDPSVSGGGDGFVGNEGAASSRSSVSADQGSTPFFTAFQHCLVRVLSAFKKPSTVFSVSTGASANQGNAPLSTAFQLLELPRDCLLRIFSALSAPDVCRVARVCRPLRDIADSDDVWSSRLPSNPAINTPSLSRKDLYFRLSARLLRKDLSQPYWLDPETGEGCFVKSARDLDIVWGGDPRYWRWEPQSDSWFVESTLLHDVCWLEVRGSLQGVFLPGAYTVSFRMKLLDSQYGWALAPVKLFLSTSNGHSVESQRFFDGRRFQRLSNLAPLRSLTSCSWMELDIGHFKVHQEMRIELKFCMMEIEGGNWKSGLVLDGVKIQPTRAISKTA